MLGIIQRYVLEKSHMHRVRQIWMEIQQHKQAIRPRHLDVIQRLLRLHHRLWRLVIWIERLHSLRHRPAIRLQPELLAELPHQIDNLRLLIALHRDQRRARPYNRRQITQWTFRLQRYTLREFYRWNIHDLDKVYTTPKQIEFKAKIWPSPVIPSSSGILPLGPARPPVGKPAGESRLAGPEFECARPSAFASYNL